MNQSSNTVRRFRPRFSLLTLLLVTTIVALSAGVWRQAGIIAPIRKELRQLRGELGYLTIEDPKEIYAIALPTGQRDIWQWRVYLPPGSTYSLSCYDGIIPSQAEHPGEEWFQAVKRSGSGSSQSGNDWGGEFTLTVRLYREEDRWFISQRSSNRKLNDSMSLVPDLNKWLSDSRSRMSVSSVSKEQNAYTPGKPMLLLHLPKPIITEHPGGGWTKKFPKDAHEGIVIWIE